MIGRAGLFIVRKVLGVDWGTPLEKPDLPGMTPVRRSSWCTTMLYVYQGGVYEDRATYNAILNGDNPFYTSSADAR
jgi:hypothetical protein